MKSQDLTDNKSSELANWEKEYNMKKVTVTDIALTCGGNIKHVQKYLSTSEARMSLVSTDLNK